MSVSPPWKVPYISLKREFLELQREILDAVGQVLSAGDFILRSQVAEFEQTVAARFGFFGVVGLNSGTDALLFATRVANVGPGAEVITTAHTFVATLASIVHVGARPILVDIGDDYNINPALIRKAVTPRTRAILPVHMNGRVCQMDEILAIAEEYDLVVIEDAAQAIGARYKNKPAGSFGRFGCFSLHPMKILGGAGDGGFITVRAPADLQAIRLLRNHGQVTKEKIATYGFNSRLDNLQATVLNAKLPHLEARIARRREIAARYNAGLKPIAHLRLPPYPDDDHHDVYSSYVIACPRRDDLAAHLQRRSIEVMIHWPTPLHLQEGLGLPKVSLPATEKVSREVLSLPIYPELMDHEQDYVIDCIRELLR